MTAAARRRRRWVALRAVAASSAFIVVGAWGFAARWHLSFRYYGSWAAALTLGSVVVEVFDPPLRSPHRLGGSDVGVCNYQFMKSGFGVKWWPSWRRSGPPLPLTSVMLPLWMPGLALAGMAWTAHGRVRRIDRIGRCLSCGYDRKGLPAGVACPECGAAEAIPRDVAPDAG